MTFQHRSLAAGRWYTLSLVEQMATIGGEVFRALNWREKGNHDYSMRAFERALELFDLTLDDRRHGVNLREIAREREALVDFFQGDNIYGSSPEILRRYYGAFNYAARRDH